MKSTFIFFIFIVFGALFCKVFSQDKSIDELQKELKLSNSIEEKIAIHKNLGELYYEKEEYIKAIEQQKNILLIGEKLKTDSLIAYAQSKLGLLFYFTGGLKESAYYYKDAIAYYERIEDHENQMVVEQNLANLYVRLADYDEARRLLLNIKEKTLLNLSDVPDSSLSKLRIYNNLGNLYYNEGNPDSALFYFLTCEDILLNIDNPLYQSIIYSNISAAYLNMKDFDTALNYAKKAEKSGEETQNQRALGLALSNKGQTLFHKGDYDGSLMALEQARDLFIASKDLFYQMETSGNLVELYEKIGATVKAFEEQKHFIILKDSLLGMDMQNIIQSIESEYALRKEREKAMAMENDKKLLEKEQKLSEVKFLFAILGNVLLIAIISLSIYSFRSKIQKKRLKEELLLKEKESLNHHLQFKQNELQRFSSFILEKNKLLDSLKQEIKTIVKSNSALKSETNALIQLIDNSIQIDENKQEIVAKAEVTNQDLMFVLDTHFPNLTKTEKRLCSLLILDISNKEIAIIMGVEPETIKGYKKRLRKKLKLPPYTNISEYLKNIS